jgi:hypothetical protein
LFQETRFFKIVKQCCQNSKTLANTLLKKNKKGDRQEIIILMRVLSITVLFRLSMMFLKSNIGLIRTKMMDSDLISDEEKKILEKKMSRLLSHYYPKIEDDNKLKAWSVSEKWVGHELIIQAIMCIAGRFNDKHKQNKEPERSENIPKLLLDSYLLGLGKHKKGSKESNVAKKPNVPEFVPKPEEVSITVSQADFELLQELKRKPTVEEGKLSKKKRAKKSKDSSKPITRSAT